MAGIGMKMRQVQYIAHCDDCDAEGRLFTYGTSDEEYFCATCAIEKVVGLQRELAAEIGLDLNEVTLQEFLVKFGHGELVEDTSVATFLEHFWAKLRGVGTAAPVPPADDPTYVVDVDYSLPLRRAITRGHFRWYNTNITAEHFPPSRQGLKQVTLEIVHLGRPATTFEVETYLAESNLRSATIEEFLAACAQDQTLGEDWLLAALGSTWQHPDGEWCVPYCCRRASGRSLELDWGRHPTYQWSSDCRFLAVRKA